MFTEPVELGVSPIDKPVNKMGPDPVEEVNDISDASVDSVVVSVDSVNVACGEIGVLEDPMEKLDTKMGATVDPVGKTTEVLGDKSVEFELDSEVYSIVDSDDEAKGFVVVVCKVLEDTCVDPEEDATEDGVYV